MTLVEFLTARLNEDAAAAKAAYDRPSDYQVYGTTETEDHFARWKPLRVLAEVDAKRRIVVEHRQTTFTDVSLGIRDEAVCAICHHVLDEPEGWPEDQWWEPPNVQQPFPCPTLRLLALPYADHPNYQEEWKP
jgi:Family of unknown function (DUF6221)